MGDTVTNLKVRFGADTKNFKADLESGKAAVDSFSGSAKSSFASFASIFGINMDVVTKKVDAFLKTLSYLAGAILGAVKAGQAKAAADMLMATASETAAAAKIAETTAMAAAVIATETLAAAEAAEAAANAAGTGATELHAAASVALETAIAAEAIAVTTAATAFEAQTAAIAAATAAGTTYVSIKEAETVANEAAATAALNSAAGSTAAGVAAGTSAVGFSIGTIAARIFKLALNALGIGLLIGAIASLVAYFTRFSEGSKIVKVALAGIGAVIDVVMDRVATLGKAIVQVFSGDFSGAAKSLNATFTGITDEISKEYDLARKLKAEILALTKETKMFDAERAAGETRIKELREKAKNTDLDQSVRMKAWKEADALEEKLAEKSLKFADKRLAAALDMLDPTTQKLKLDAKALDLIDRIKNGTITAAEAQKTLGTMTLSSADLTGKFNTLVETIVENENEHGNLIQTRLRLQKGENSLKKEMIADEISGIKSVSELKDQQAKNDKLSILQRTKLILDAAELQRNALQIDFNAKNINYEKFLAELDKLAIDTDEKIKAIREKLNPKMEVLSSIKLTADSKTGKIAQTEITAPIAEGFETSKLEASAAKIKSIYGDLQETTVNIGASIAEAANSLAVSFGENLGLLLAGADGAKGIGEILGSAFGDMLVTIGKATISAGTAFLAMSLMFQAGIATPGAAIAAIAAGIALVAIGSAFKSAVSSATSGGGTYSSASSGSSYGSGVSSSGSAGSIRSAPLQIIVSGDFKLKNGDLVASINQHNQRKKTST